jgi:hypothetical protein
MRRPFPDDRMPSEVPRKSLPRKRSFLRGDAHLRKQPASQPASQRAHTTRASCRSESYAVCAQGQGSFFFFFLKGKKNSQLKENNSNDAQYV